MRAHIARVAFTCCAIAFWPCSPHAQGWAAAQAWRSLGPQVLQCLVTRFNIRPIVLGQRWGVYPGNPRYADMVRSCQASLAQVPPWHPPVPPQAPPSFSSPAGGGPTVSIGPSFDCSKATQPLAKMICASPALSKLDLRFAQAYWALRQQVGPQGQHQLLQKAIDFGNSVLQACGIPESGPVLGSPDCVAAQYERQRSVWLSRLNGPAHEEATRPIRQHIALQGDLRKLGFLPATEKIDGVYGPAMRAAILAWQGVNKRPQTGFLSDADASVLETTASPSASPPSQAGQPLQGPSGAVYPPQNASEDLEKQERRKEEAEKAEKLKIDALWQVFRNNIVKPDDNISALLNYSSLGSDSGSSDSFWTIKSGLGGMYVEYQKGDTIQKYEKVVTTINPSKIDPAQFFIKDEGDIVKIVADGKTLFQCSGCNRAELQERWLAYFSERAH